jgi:hypothetical protein
MQRNIDSVVTDAVFAPFYGEWERFCDRNGVKIRLGAKKFRLPA